MKGLKVLPYLQFVRVGDDLAIYGRSDEVWTASGRSVADLERLIPHLDGKTRLDDAAARAGLALETATAITTYLKQKGLVKEVDERPPEVGVATTSPDLHRQSLFLSRFDPSLGSETTARLARALVAIAGSPSLADDVAVALRRIGVGHVVQTGGDLTLPEATPDLAIICEYGEGPGVFRRADHMCRQRGQAWLRVAVQHDVLAIGPLFIPGTTACYQCYELRLFSNVSLPDYDLPLYSHQVAAGSEAASASFGAAGLLAAGLAALAVLKYLTRMVPCELVGHEYTLRMVDLEAQLRPLLRVPVCHHCVAGKRPLHALLAQRVNDPALKESGDAG